MERLWLLLPLLVTTMENMRMGTAGVALPKRLAGMPSRLSEALFDRPFPVRGSLAPLASNLAAIQACERFIEGRQRLVVILGASGWGRTHLLRTTCQQISAHTETSVIVSSAIDWLTQLPRLDSQQPLILDDTHDALIRPRARQAIRSVLERRVSGSGSCLLSFESSVLLRNLKEFLPNAREWLIASISHPDLEERQVVVRHMACVNGLYLADTVVHLLARKTLGNGRTLAGALQRLKLIQSEWIDQPSVLRSFGVLYPYLGDGKGWDLRDHVHEVVSRSLAAEAVHIGHDVELCVYLMMHGLGLSEKDVASYFQLMPGEVYAIANVQRAKHASGARGELPDRCAQALLASIHSL